MLGLNLNLELPLFLRQVNALFGPFHRKKLGVVLTAEYEFVHYDDKGHVIGRYRKKSHSFMQWWEYYVYAMFSDIHSTPTITDINGSSQAPSYHDSYGISGFGIAWASNTSSSCGIVVGSSSQAITPSLNKLASQIGNGTSSGQLIYGTQSYFAPTVSGSNVSFSMYRLFTNGSSAEVDIHEIGIYCEGTTSGHNTFYFMGIYDVPSQYQAVAAGHSVVLTYTLTLSCA
jgi:hypothetical protein